jgi:uncharacterized membrane protein
MSVVETSLLVEAPPEEVWSVVSDPRNLPEWDRHIIAVEGVPPTGIRKGTEYSTTVRLMGVRARIGARVLEFRSSEYSKIRLTGVLDATVETWLEPVDGGRSSRLRHRIDYRFRGGPLGAISAAAVRRLGAGALLRRGTEAQKQQAEHR